MIWSLTFHVQLYSGNLYSLSTGDWNITGSITTHHVIAKRVQSINTNHKLRPCSKIMEKFHFMQEKFLKDEVLHWYLHPYGLVLLKVISRGKFQMKSCRWSLLFLVIWDMPSSRPCERQHWVTNELQNFDEILQNLHDTVPTIFYSRFFECWTYFCCWGSPRASLKDLFQLAVLCRVHDYVSAGSIQAVKCEPLDRKPIHITLEERDASWTLRWGEVIRLFLVGFISYPAISLTPMGPRASSPSLRMFLKGVDEISSSSTHPDLGGSRSSLQSHSTSHPRTLHFFPSAEAGRSPDGNDGPNSSNRPTTLPESTNQTQLLGTNQKVT